MTPIELRPGLHKAARALDASGCAWALVGGVAVVARASIRTTKDIDVVVAVDLAGLPSLLAHLAAEGFTGDEAEIREFAPGGLVRLWLPPGRRQGLGLDLLFADDELSRQILDRATPVEIGGLSIPVATPEDLILMKLDANRPTDLDDVIALKDAFDATLDRPYLARMAGRLGIEARMRAFVGP